jgi:hypothetical protein
MSNKTPIIALAIVTSLGVAFAWWLADTVRAVNEPDVRTVPPARIEGILGAGGIHATITDLIYVNQDYNGCIFIGSVRDHAAEFEKVSTGTGQTEFVISDFNGRYGLLREKPVQRGNLVGVILSTTRGEAIQGRPGFEKRWSEALDKFDRR